ncbi:MAG: hypothetical protein NTY09_14455 [bacterium]|nr:hypothetical protein [bacterium]
MPPICEIWRQPDELMGAWFTNQSPISSASLRVTGGTRNNALDIVDLY